MFSTTENSKWQVQNHFHIYTDKSICAYTPMCECKCEFVDDKQPTVVELFSTIILPKLRNVFEQMFTSSFVFIDIVQIFKLILNIFSIRLGQKYFVKMSTISA